MSEPGPLHPDLTAPETRKPEARLPESGTPLLTLLLAEPRGFCAGVDRAVQIVERALGRYGAPVYVRHEIVHNRAVVERLETLGAVFVEELDEVPDGVPVVFSAHGVPKSVPRTAEQRGLFYIDATCPLVSKVHREAERYAAEGRLVILIGHAGHPEVIGTMGQLPPGAVRLVETVADVARLDVPDGVELAYCTQTTLSVDDTATIIAALRARFPAIAAPRREDICYATTNRQAAVKQMAGRAEAVLVIGAANSSNSNRLVEVALAHGAGEARLIRGADDIDWAWLAGFSTVGLTAGASAPETLVEDVIAACRERRAVTVEPVSIGAENVVFKLPASLS